MTSFRHNMHQGCCNPYDPNRLITIFSITHCCFPRQHWITCNQHLALNSVLGLVQNCWHYCWVFKNIADIMSSNPILDTRISICPSVHHAQTTPSLKSETGCTGERSSWRLISLIGIFFLAKNISKFLDFLKKMPFWDFCIFLLLIFWKFLIV